MGDHIYNFGGLTYEFDYDMNCLVANSHAPLEVYDTHDKTSDLVNIYSFELFSFRYFPNKDQ